ncbi:hypothetical protein GN956_G23364 [Arapaima gigas]
MTALAELPEEVWLIVFSYLTPQDKTHARASCRFFKRLVDHPCLWRKRTVVLKENRCFSLGLWNSLRRRRIAAIVLQRAAARDLECMAKQLPWLTSLTIERCSDSKAFRILPHFKNLCELVMVAVPFPPSLADSVASMGQLAHLCLCGLTDDPRAGLVCAATHLVSLTTLRYHQSDHPLSKRAMHTLLSCLPSLKCLSLKMGKLYGMLPDDYFTVSTVSGDKRAAGQQGQCESGLTKLELLHYMDPILSPVALGPLSSLERLTVSYQQTSVEAPMCNLSSWLRKLPHLTELMVISGYSFDTYVHSVPATLRTLSLRNVIFRLADMRNLGKRAPGIQHLYIDRLSCKSLCSLSEVLVLFHQLRTLQMCYPDVDELDFRSLAQLQHLEQLVFLNSHPSPTADHLDQIHKFKCQTDYRVQVIHSECRRDPYNCYCCL